MKVKHASRPRDSRKYWMQKLLNEYMQVHGNAPVNPNDLYVWARRNKKWEPQEKSIRKQFREELQEAAREETYTDPQGRTVRRKHAVKIKEGETQLVMWADIETAPPEHMRLSLQQRRKGIGGDVRQLKTDLDSYNDNNRHGASIQMSFNFDEDLAEAEHSTEYPESPPDDEN